MGTIAHKLLSSTDMKLSVILALVGVAFAAAIPLDAPEPVTDTEDVVKAKEDFQVAYDAAAKAAAAGAVPDVVLPEGGPTPVADTEEVAAAKAEFQAAYDAAAAEAAPDNDLDGAISTHQGYLSGIDGRLSPYYTNTLPYGAFGLHAPVLAGAPLVAGAHHVVGSPLVAGAPLVKSTVAAGTHLIGGHPLAYSGLGLHGLYGYGLHGYGYGLHSPFVQVVAKEE